MSALARVSRSAVAFRPLPAAQRELRTSSILRTAEPYEAKPPKQTPDHNKLLGAGAVACVVGFWWFYRGGKPPAPVAKLDASGEGAGMNPPTK